MNRWPPPDMLILATEKLGAREAVLAWFRKPLWDGNPVTPQLLLNINADWIVMELLNDMPARP